MSTGAARYPGVLPSHYQSPMLTMSSTNSFSSTEYLLVEGLAGIFFEDEFGDDDFPVVALQALSELWV